MIHRQTRVYSVIFALFLAFVAFFSEEKMALAESAQKTSSNSVYAEPISGKIIEIINAATYTYLKLKTKTDETWVAVPHTDLGLNTEVTLDKPMPMFGFQSKSLKRKFDRIYFGVLRSQKEQALKQQEKNSKKE